jgi:hypothetical protein
MRSKNSLRLAAATLIVVMGVSPAAVAAPRSGETPAHYCARAGNDDQLRPAPGALGPAVARLFSLAGTDAAANSFYRCSRGRVLVCNVGANLPCGRASLRKRLPVATQWCASHENADAIPMAVTGHDTPYTWRCAGRNARPGAPVARIDRRGFFADYWRKLE